MAFPYKHVLLVGATAGIGRAMATKLLSSGVSVTAVGRRTSRLEELVSSHKSSTATASYETFDINDIAAAPGFAKSVLAKHPTVDCVFLNAGTQRTYDWGQPGTVDLSAFNAEMHTNFTALVALTHAFLPLLQAKAARGEQTSVIYTGTHLSLVPALYLSAYSASKAALNAFILCLRDFVKHASPNVRIIEVSPPVVQTELHDYMGEEQGRKMGMPVEVFTEQAYTGLCSGEDKVIIGGLGLPGTDAAKKMTVEFHEMVKLQQSAFGTMAEMLRAARH